MPLSRTFGQGFHLFSTMSPFLRILCAGAALLAHAVHAQDVRYSAFGTIGYTRSSSEYRYQRAIDSDGTLARDSLFGVQLDASLAPALSATVQARLAPASNNDEEVNLRLPWAFLSWRPSNALTVQAGKMRLPVLLYAENIDVGATFPFARLPVEIYAILPAWDFYGVSAAGHWTPGALEVDLDSFVGWSRTSSRVYLRDRPGSNGPVAWFEGIHGGLAGAVLSVRRDDSRYRLGVLVWDTRLDTLSFARDYPYVPIAPGIGYYQTANDLPGPGVQMQARTRSQIVTAGFESELPAGFRAVGEGVIRWGDRVSTAAGTDAWGGYLSLLRPMGAWTPYVYGATLRSSSRARKLYATLNGNRVPDFVPNAAMLNATQIWGADSVIVSDQRTWALGTSYALARGQVVKAEWQRTHVGLKSAFLDVPAGTPEGGRQLDVFSLSYSFSF